MRISRRDDLVNILLVIQDLISEIPERLAVYEEGLDKSDPLVGSLCDECNEAYGYAALSSIGLDDLIDIITMCRKYHQG